MIFSRRRLYIWLIKAYLKRWGRRIFLFFVLGLLGFFLLLQLGKFILPKIPVGTSQSLGVVGAYTIDTLPQSIVTELSHGLTRVSSDGIPRPDVAKSWTIKDSGKAYVFYIRDDVYFTDGKKLTSDLITYSFSDVQIHRPNKNTIEFRLKDSYSPFLITASRPIFKKNFVGLGQYKIKKIKLNGPFVESISIQSRNHPYNTKNYYFYPSQEALKVAFALGEVNQAIGLTNLEFKNTSLVNFSNAKTNRNVNYRQLVTLFFNTQDSVVSDIKLRNALSYALPDTFLEGQRNYSPFSALSWTHIEGAWEKKYDLQRAKSFIDSSASASESANLILTLKTLPKYEQTAKIIAKSWKDIGVSVKIEVVESVPERFQIFLGDFRVPKDPDQYTLWHKDQENNITKYSNLRIDKLLEDGRKITNMDERKKIYSDFQKYLLADSPASFLYFPYEYDVIRK